MQFLAPVFTFYKNCGYVAFLMISRTSSTCHYSLRLLQSDVFVFETQIICKLSDSICVLLNREPFYAMSVFGRSSRANTLSKHGEYHSQQTTPVDKLACRQRTVEVCSESLNRLNSLAAKTSDVELALTC